MTSRVIPLIDSRLASPSRARGGYAETPAGGELADELGRPLRDLRISVTDRCNFRCTYCMPKEVFDSNYRFLRHADLLTFEEIARLARAFVQQGVEKIRLTGGEPLLRKDLHKLIAMLSPMTTRSGRPVDIALTTNGSVLARKAQQLADAGLKRITVSLDGLDDVTFRRMNDVDFPVRDVLAGIDAATAAGLAPVKINMVVKRGVNEREIVGDGALLSRHRPYRSVYRIHGRWHVKRLAHGRSGAVQRRSATYRRAVCTGADRCQLHR